jgi:hypothetical protein
MIKSEKIVLMSMDRALFVGGKKSRYYEEIRSFETTEGDFRKLVLSGAQRQPCACFKERQ